MKVFLRVLVTVLILTGLGFGVYFIFFKPAGDDVVFLKLSNIMEYKQTNGVDAITSNRVDDKINLIVQNQDSIATIDRNGIYSCDFNSSLLLNPNEFNVEVVSDGSVKNYNIVSCKSMDEKLNGVFDYYFAYSQAAKNVSKNTQKDLEKAIKEYKGAYDELNQKLNAIISVQNSIIATADDNENYALELNNRYYNAVVAYRNCLKNYSDLILKVKNYVIKYVFDNSIINDADITQNDIMLYAIKNAVSVDFGKLANGVSDSNRVEAIRLLYDVNVFSAPKLEEVYMVETGNVVVNYSTNKIVFVPKKVVVNEATGETAWIIINGTTYRLNENGKWLACDPYNNYVITGNESGALNVDNNMAVDTFYAKADIEQTTDGGLTMLKSSKFVENYTYIVNNGYLNELITMLSNAHKDGFMDSSAGYGIVDICVPSIQYILACYGFAK